MTGTDEDSDHYSVSEDFRSDMKDMKRDLRRVVDDMSDIKREIAVGSTVFKNLSTLPDKVGKLEIQNAVQDAEVSRIKLIVYGGCGAVLIAVLGMIIALVAK